MNLGPMAAKIKVGQVERGQYNTVYNSIEKSREIQFSVVSPLKTRKTVEVLNFDFTCIKSMLTQICD